MIESIFVRAPAAWVDAIGLEFQVPMHCVDLMAVCMMCMLWLMSLLYYSALCTLSAVCTVQCGEHHS